MKSHLPHSVGYGASLSLVLCCHGSGKSGFRIRILELKGISYIT